VGVAVGFGVGVKVAVGVWVGVQVGVGDGVGVPRSGRPACPWLKTMARMMHSINIALVR